MIERFNTSNKNERAWLLDMIENNRDYDFYYTSNNTRTYISDDRNLRGLFKDSQHVFAVKEKGDYQGVILVWKSIGGGKVRHYVKVCAESSTVVKNLITILLWNARNDLFVKVRKDSRFVSAFKSKGFKFKGGRGEQVLLSKKYKPQTPSKIYKDHDGD